MADYEKVKNGVTCCGIKNNCGGCEYFKAQSGCIDDLLRDVFEVLEERKPEKSNCGEWILTTNELPTPSNSYFGEQYIVCNTIGQVFPLRYIRRTDVHRKTVDRWHYEDGRIYGCANIVAWMKMPKPLKIFEENKDGANNE